MTTGKKKFAAKRSGPLKGLRIIEIGGIGPAPFCGMMLSDLGADVLRIDRHQASDLGLPLDPRFDVTSRGRRSVTANLKDSETVKTVLTIAEKADALIEGFRPGVMERLGLGPDDMLKRNPRLVYGRITGWGQHGPLAHAAGHDINYIALTGALHAIGRAGTPPAIPLNLIGDYAGGAAYLAFGIVSALLEASRSGQGQVIDAAMTDGASSLMSMVYGRYAGNEWTDQRASNELDGGAPWYDIYETADNKYVAIGAIEPKFFRELLQRVGIDSANWSAPHDRACWPALREELTKLFKARTQTQWAELLEGTDACFAPVLGIEEAPHHAHNVAREAFVEVDGVSQPAPAPRFSRTPGSVMHGAPELGGGGGDALADWGFTQGQINHFRKKGLYWLDE